MKRGGKTTTRCATGTRSTLTVNSVNAIAVNVSNVATIR